MLSAVLLIAVGGFAYYVYRKKKLEREILANMRESERGSLVVGATGNLNHTVTNSVLTR